MEKLKSLDLLVNYLSKPYGKGLNIRSLVAVILEFSKVDASLATLLLVQIALL